jgi:predicted metalloprotease with PDZ domain
MTSLISSPIHLHYQLTPADPAAHYFEVRLSIEHPTSTGQQVSLPAWIPGSYMMRDFARHITQITARNTQGNLLIHKLDKHTWQVAASDEPIQITYRIYAWDDSVRAAYLDQTRGFVNGTSVFLRVHGQEDEPCWLSIDPPHLSEEDIASHGVWRVATGLTRVIAKDAGESLEFGLFQAMNYDALIDHPIEMGIFEHYTFDVHGVPHELVISGRHWGDVARLLIDLQKICTWQIELFEPHTRRAPFERFVFMLNVTENGYGGLEHRNSTALVTSRDDLPKHGDASLSDGYIQLLGLFSHEYFHSWLVKRIQPLEFKQYDLTREHYTSLLWLFEGFTAYYDDLCLVRCGVINHQQYLKLLARPIRQSLQHTGRLHQTLAESSFDAWIKYYRPDENSINTTISYYAKGSMVALCLDLMIRNYAVAQQTHWSLDDVMRYIWQHFGVQPDRAGQGLLFYDVLSAVEVVTGLNVSAFMHEAIFTTGDLPISFLLATAGVEMSWFASSTLPDLGIKTTVTAQGVVKIAQVFQDGAGHRAGLSAGDEIVALNSLRVTQQSWNKLQSHFAKLPQWVLHVFRRDELWTCTIAPQPPAQDNVRLSAIAPLHPADLALSAAIEAEPLWRQWFAR